VVGGVDEAVPLVAERRSSLLMVFVFQRRERRLEQMRQGRGLCAGLLAVEGKKKIKGEGRPAYVNRGREACGRPYSLWFSALWEGGGRRSS
jgi:hypothetical protein